MRKCERDEVLVGFPFMSVGITFGVREYLIDIKWKEYE